MGRQKENTVNVSMKYHASVYRDLDADASARNRAARAELPCSECGSADGMQGGWDRKMISFIDESGHGVFLERGKFVIGFWRPNLKAITLFRCSGNDHELYSTCWQCNPNGIIPTDFEALTPEQVAVWLVRECTCLDCERERKKDD